MERKPSSEYQFPPGFRFHPSDEELVVHYLKNKVSSNPLPATIIADIDLYKYNPWELPKKALFGEDEWYFFTPRDRKYPNGARPNRAAASGYWKATGTDKPILTSCGTKSIGVKKALVFYKGRPPKGFKTDWIMHEYRLLDTILWTPKRKGSMRLDDWVLCRVRQKGTIPKSTWEDQNIPNYEAAGYFPKLNELCSTTTNPDIEMIRSYLYSDCPMLPYLLASQDLPCSLDFRSSESSCAEEDFENKLHSPFPSFSSFFNPLKRKLVEENPGESFIPLQKLTKGDDEKENVILMSSDGCSDVNFGGTDQSKCNNFSPEQWNSMQYE